MKLLERKIITDHIKGPMDPSLPAILLAAFGSNSEAGRSTYEKIDKAFEQSFPDHRRIWGFTSKTVKKRMSERNTPIADVSEALEILRAEGVESCAVVPLFVIPGEEYERITGLKVSGMKIHTALPLLAGAQDIERVASLCLSMIQKDTATILAGHGNGSDSSLNAPLLSLERHIRKQSEHAFLATFDGEPGVASLEQFSSLSGQNRSIDVLPLLMVSGVHVEDDVLGEKPSSWKNILGDYELSILPSLGMHPGIQQVFIDHCSAALDTLTSRKAFKPQNGHFYAVGVGPGAPDLLTRRAETVIRAADVIIAPKSAVTTESLALETVADCLRPDQQILEHVYSMSRDLTRTMENWSQIARKVKEYCNEGKKVVQITLGDPHLYSTTAYLMSMLREQMDETLLHIIPGISAFQAAAASFTEPLTSQEDRMILMSAQDMDAVSDALERCETLVLYKCASVLDQLATLLEQKGLIDQARLVCYAEQEQQLVFNDIRDAVHTAKGYMATATIHVRRKSWAV
ncbi:precorrin-2 C(20)-methyltransferase [Chitinispirillales bacterium ANBcel5]|uniref:precorrin-2 C(20)-methyltransferase n=1 Tax=Cellulosispirillum alkaliphilum TaxID=3039283 RepID=UPI002A588789|nr:precorrin-2 C(20)-methyltransferase [Chitinispirillales bacterium ANBcel5]